jgi:hypothetical protein
MFSRWLEICLAQTSSPSIVISAALVVAGAAYAQASVDSVRIEAKDTVALAKFYQQVFGMQEISCIVNPGGIEVFVNFAPRSKPPRQIRARG